MEMKEVMALVNAGYQLAQVNQMQNQFTQPNQMQTQFAQPNQMQTQFAQSNQMQSIDYKTLYETQALIIKRFMKLRKKC